jgi:hypothetical protein
MSAKEYFDSQQAGGFNTYPDRVTKKIFFKKDVTTKTKPATILSGQVLKAYTFLESNSVGKLIAHSGVNEKALVTFADITAGQTIILAGLTFTDAGAGTTKEDLVIAWSSLAVGTTAAAANTQNPVSTGSFTAGTLAGYNTEGSDTADSVLFVSTTPFAGVTDLADTGTATDPTVTILALESPIKPIAGVTLYDVDASSADVDAEVYETASFWADDDGTCALIWKVDPATATVTKADGTTVACTPYNTGCYGDTAAARLLKRKFVEGSKFEPIGFVKVGDKI